MVAKACVVMAVAVLAAGCGSSEQAARAFLERGDRYAESGQYDAAILEYRNAIKKQPGWSGSYRRLGDAYVALGKPEEAYRAYTSAIDADPSDLRAHIEAGRLLLAAKLYDQAQRRAERVLDRDPLNVDALVLRYRSLGDSALSKGDRTNAEAAFQSAVVDAPNSAEAYVALANFLLATDRRSEAEAILLKGVAVDPHSELANRALASLYVNTSRAADAEPYLKAAAAVPRQRYRSSLALADYYYAANRYAEARAALERVTSDAARIRLVAIDYELGAGPDAQARLDKILKTQKQPPAEGLALNARLLANERKLDEAQRAANAALAIEPRLPAANYVIGSIALERGQLDKAEQAFQAVLDVMPTHTHARLQLARVRLESGRPAEAVALAQEAGNDRLALMMLARALVADGQVDRARDQLNALATDAPAAVDPGPDIALGSLDLNAGDLNQAAAHAARALAIAPASPDALELAGSVAIAQGDHDAAVQYLTRAIENASDSFDAHAMLAHLYAEQGDVDGARTLLEGFAGRHPDAAAPRTAVGIVCQSAGRDADARTWYEQALALDSKEPVAAGNLARLYLDDPSRLETAIDLARTAASQLPDQAEVHDTLGWAYFKAGRLRPAVAELERAASLDAHEPAYQKHLEEARQALSLEAHPNKANALMSR